MLKTLRYKAQCLRLKGSICACCGPCLYTCTLVRNWHMHLCAVCWSHNLDPGPRRNEPKSSAIVSAPCRLFANTRAQGLVSWPSCGAHVPQNVGDFGPASELIMDSHLATDVSYRFWPNKNIPHKSGFRCWIYFHFWVPFGEVYVWGDGSLPFRLGHLAW